MKRASHSRAPFLLTICGRHRCPLELQLRRDTQTYAVISRPANVGMFGGKTGETVTQRIDRLEDVTAAIEKFTEEIAVRGLATPE